MSPILPLVEKIKNEINYERDNKLLNDIKSVAELNTLLQYVYILIDILTIYYLQYDLILFIYILLFIEILFITSIIFFLNKFRIENYNYNIIIIISNLFGGIINTLIILIYIFDINYNHLFYSVVFRLMGYVILYIFFLYLYTFFNHDNLFRR